MNDLAIEKYAESARYPEDSSNEPRVKVSQEIYTGAAPIDIKNITPFTKTEAEKKGKELEKRFKEVVTVLTEIGYIIEEMDRRKGWEQLNYQDYTEWAKARLGYEKTFAYLYKNAAALEVRLIESKDKELVNFLQMAKLEHKAILHKIPRGKEKEAILVARGIASAEGKKKPNADHYKRAVNDILSRELDEEKKQILINEKEEYWAWMKARNNSNLLTLESALKYLQEFAGDEKIDRRIGLIEERLEKLNKKDKSKKENNKSSGEGEQQIKEEIFALARSITEEYLRDLESDDERASALIRSVEGDEKTHINAIAEQFPLNQRPWAVGEIEKVLASLHHEYVQSIVEGNVEENSSPAIANNRGTETGSEDSHPEETIGESPTTELPTGSNDPGAETGSEDSHPEETIGESPTTELPTGSNDPGTETSSEDSHPEETIGESPATELPTGSNDRGTETGSEDSSPAETIGESPATELPTGSNDRGTETGSEDSSPTETIGESPTTELPTGSNDRGTETGSEDSSSAETIGESSAAGLEISANAIEVETIFHCSSTDELKAYISEMSPEEILKEIQDLWKDWNRLSEKVSDSENKLEERAIEARQLERRIREKEIEINEGDKTIQQLRSIVKSLEGQLEQYQSSNSSQEDEIRVENLVF